MVFVYAIKPAHTYFDYWFSAKASSFVDYFAADTGQQALNSSSIVTASWPFAAGKLCSYPRVY